MLKKLITRYNEWRRERLVLYKCGCIVRCPRCKNILNDNAEWRGDKDGTSGAYSCNGCGAVSSWYFGPPVPILLELRDKECGCRQEKR